MRAAPDALQLLESAVPAQAQEAAMQTWVERFVGSLLKQSVERIARVREVGAFSSSCYAVPSFPVLWTCETWNKHTSSLLEHSSTYLVCTGASAGLVLDRVLAGPKTVAGSRRLTNCKVVPATAQMTILQWVSEA